MTTAFFRSFLFKATFVFLFLNLFAPSVHAQDESGMLQNGDGVVTGFSGVKEINDGNGASDRSDLDRTFIDADGAVVQVFDLSRPGGPRDAQVIDAPVKLKISAREIGQVFGVALDQQTPPNIYVGATSLHGLHIVATGPDGRDERIRTGQSGARWMNGLFGEDNGGGPGSIWKIDGVSGAVSLFANVKFENRDNGGPGLGNLAYDSDHDLLFVSDLQTGIIHQFDMEGNELATFDHGLIGRPQVELDEVRHDPGFVGDITSPDFDIEDPESWGYAPDSRQVWGLSYHNGRLFYAVSEGGAIYSVGIADDGAFTNDVRIELEIAEKKRRYPVSDIAFTEKGDMILAQRGGIVARYDYTRHHTPRKNHVWRYRKERPDDEATTGLWKPVPDEYAIGFPASRRNTSGGVAIGYDYKTTDSGEVVFGKCEGTLWSTGDRLRRDPENAERLREGGRLNVHGLQGNALNDLKDGIEPPWKSYFVDYYGDADNSVASNVAGFVGDIEIPRQCEGVLLEEPPEYVELVCPGDDPRCPKERYRDIRVSKIAGKHHCESNGLCPFTIVARNVGDKGYFGPIWLRDVAQDDAAMIGYSSAFAWSCWISGPQRYDCWHDETYLAPGEAVSIRTTFKLAANYPRHTFRNCARIKWPYTIGDVNPFNDHDCDVVPVCKIGDKICGPDLAISKEPQSFQCENTGKCHFAVTVKNVGGRRYIGKPQIEDVFTPPGATLIDYGPKPNWNCQLGPTVTCTHWQVTLNPGEQRTLNMSFQLSPPTPAGTYPNCAVTKKPVPGGMSNVSALNDKACTLVSFCPIGAPAGACKSDLEIKKFADSAICSPGEACFYRVVVRNVGSADHNGPVIVRDPTPNNLTFVNSNPQWGCVPDGDTQVCTFNVNPVILAPGDSLELELEYNLEPDYADLSVTNCATLPVVAPLDDNPANDGPSCATIPVAIVSPIAATQSDLQIVKTPLTPTCAKGEPCAFRVTARNNGPAPFPGIVSFRDKIPAGLEFVGIDPWSLWSCKKDGGNVACQLDPGPQGFDATASSDVVLAFNVDPGFAGDEISNTAIIDADGEIDGNQANNSSTATVEIKEPEVAAPEEKKLDIKMSPRSATCTLEENCSFDVSITNDANKAFEDTVSLEDIIRLSGAGQTAALTNDILVKQPVCKKRPNDANVLMACDQKLKLAPNESFDFSVTVRLGADDRVSVGDKVRNVFTLGHRANTYDAAATVTVVEDETGVDPITEDKTHDLEISKSVKGRCRSEEKCAFTVNIENVGEGAYTGMLSFTDTIEPQMRPLTASGGWTCSSRAQIMTCTRAELTLEPGDRVRTNVVFRAPSVSRTTSVRNCVELVPIGGGANATSVADVQNALNEAGYDAGEVTGRSSRQTRNAIRQYRRDNGLPSSSIIDSVLIESLIGARVSGGSVDDNPSNDRSCVSTRITQVVTPEPEPCTRGRVRNARGQCVCPRSRPIWDRYEQRCVRRDEPNPDDDIELPEPIICTGGRRPTPAGRCVCPPNRPIWDRKRRRCVVDDDTGPGGPDQCTGGRVPSRSGACVCPPGKPIWNRRLKRCVGDGGIVDGGPPPICLRNRGLVLRGRACVCRKGYRPARRDSKGRLIRCVRKGGPGIGPIPDDRPTCINGKLRKIRGQWRCFCPNGAKPKRGVCPPRGGNPGPGNGGGITEPPTGPNCSSKRGLRRIGKRCACLPNYQLVRSGRNGAALCRRKSGPPGQTQPGGPGRKPDCVNGKLRKRGGAWRCVCSKGYRRVPSGCQKFQFPKPGKPKPKPRPRPSPKPDKNKGNVGVKIKCFGGSVVGKACVCGKNKVARRLNPTTYRCQSINKPKRPVPRKQP